MFPSVPMWFKFLHKYSCIIALFYPIVIGFATLGLFLLHD